MPLSGSVDRRKIMSAFRKYTRLGLASHTLSPLDAYARIRGCCRSRSEACDLLAVYDTVRILRILGKNDVLEAVRDVYFCRPSARILKNEISERVARRALESNCDERTVYRQLAFARRLYTKIRGGL
ncbi:MAG: hypothetical protein ACI3XQ_00775 [Eubacteriales bacterium]